MKKKGFIYVTFLIMILVLSACGQDKTKESDSENTKKEVTLSDVLNDKQERKIVMTHDSEVYDSPDVMYAGTIGKGKVEIHPYTNFQDFEFNQLKDLSMNDYKEVLAEKDAEYKRYGDNANKNLDIKPVDAKVKLLKPEDNEKRAKIVGLDYDAQYYTDDDKFDMLLRGYEESKSNSPKGWLTLEAYSKDQKNPYVLNIEAKNGETNLKLENIDEAKKKYKNVKVVEE